MTRPILAAFFALAMLLGVSGAWAQTTATTGAGVSEMNALRLATVTRPPFSFIDAGAETGFSLALWQALTADLGRTTEIVRAETFSDMLDMVRDGSVDAAAANISITADREAEMDFSHPIFEAGLRIMVPAGEGGGSSIFSALFSQDLLVAIAVAFGLLLVVGMLMWVFERHSQPYFDQPARKALFPAFWWALNLVVNGGFEERQPKSLGGRMLGVLLVVSSLFVVSVFVAKITATMTVEAIQSSVNTISDLYGKRVGTTRGSTAARFLDQRDIRHSGYDDFDTLIAAFETDELDAVVFDAPILAYYANTASQGQAELVGPVFLRENYGIALPSGSPLAETLNQSLLRLREDGTYDSLRQAWFGPANG